MDSAYIEAIAQSVSAAGFNAQTGDRLLFNYHSIPMKDIEQGDTYEPQTGATALAVAGRLRLDRTQWTIGYNCRFDKKPRMAATVYPRRSQALGAGARWPCLHGLPEFRGRLP